MNYADLKGFKDFKIKNYLERIPYFKEGRQRAFATIVLTLIALSVFGLLAINPTISTIIKLRKELEDSKNVEQQLQTKIDNIGKLQRQFSSMQSDLPIIFAAVPSSPEPTQLIGKLQAISQESRVTLSKIQVFEAEMATIRENKSLYSKTSFFIEIDGPLENVNAFLKQLVSFDRIVAPQTISLIQKETGLYQMTIRADAYYKQKI